MLKEFKIRGTRLLSENADLVATLAVGAIAFILFLTTLQLNINGSSHPYVTDVGEIQNALPRWGTIHFTGYPQFTFLGSVFVSVMGLFGLGPAAAASLYSAAWGSVAIGLLTYLTITLGVPPLAAAATALLFGLSTSYWVDASIAEVHTMTMALTFAALLAAVRFGRDGRKADLFWLAFLSGQGLAHQRAFAFVGLGLLVLVVHRWQAIRRSLPAVIGLFLLGPLTYIYLPLRAWMGAGWTFNAPGTWSGFWLLVFDNKAERIVESPESAMIWFERAQGVTRLLADDWPWPLIILGLAGLLFAGSIGRHERLGLNLVWIPVLIVSFVIWIGRVGEAVLANKLPVVAMAAIGLGLLSRSLWDRRPALGRISAVVWLVIAGALYVVGRGDVLAITRDPGAEATIAVVDQIEPAVDGRAITFMALEGNDYWQLAYAQSYEDHFPHLEVVSHRANFNEILDRGDHLLTLSQTFYLRPLGGWQQLLGSVHLSGAAPGVVEIKKEPNRPAAETLSEAALDLENGIVLQSTEAAWSGAGDLVLEVEWRALNAVESDYSVAVHLVGQDPPTGPQDILAQADRSHPVEGWYPTSGWQVGEVVRDYYLLNVPPGSRPAAVRVAMYQVTADGSFQNTEWLSLPVPERP
jgi:hypothetical protein